MDTENRVDQRGEIFEPALAEMNGDVCIWGPTSFRDYLEQNSLSAGKAPEYISIDSYERLPQVLRDADTMVLRLGKCLSGTGTQFSLVRVRTRLRDFFLLLARRYPLDRRADEPRQPIQRYPDLPVLVRPGRAIRCISSLRPAEHAADQQD